MHTIDYMTRTENRPMRNASVPGYFPIGIDVGYSGTKVVCPTKVLCFPSYAIKVKGQLLDMDIREADDNVFFRWTNKPDVIWAVGKSAQERLQDQDTTSTSERIYTRNRYFSESFQILVSAAIGLSVIPNQYGSAGGRDVRVQTGLPAQYLRHDAKDIAEAFAGERHFDLKIGNSDWKHFDSNIVENQVGVMAQPMGTLLSTMMDDMGRETDSLQTVLSSRTLIIDPGFLTLDTVLLDHGVVAGMETFDDLGMHEVLERTCRELSARYGVEARVDTIQPHLKSGKFIKYDRKTHTGKDIPFGDILEKKSDEVAAEAMTRLDETYDYLEGLQYIIVTGGTGEAWFNSFVRAFGQIPDVRLLRSNQNTVLPMLYGNARGYYFGMVGTLKELAKKQDAPA